MLIYDKDKERGGGVLFKVEFVNAQTQEILREVPYKDENSILEMINMFNSKSENKNDTYLIDNQFRSLDAEYVTYSTYQEIDLTVYKLFFKVQLSENQFKVKH